MRWASGSFASPRLALPREQESAPELEALADDLDAREAVQSRARAAALPPRITSQSFDRVQLRLVEDVAHADLRAADDHREHATVLRRFAHVADARFELARRQVTHQNHEL